MIILLISHPQPLTAGNDDIKTPPDTSNKLLFLIRNPPRDSEEKLHTTCQWGWDEKHMCHFQRDTFLKHLLAFSNSTVSLQWRAKVQKARNQHTLGLEGKPAVWRSYLAWQWKILRLVTTSLETLPKEKIQVHLFQWARIQKSTHIVCFYLNIWLYICKTIWFCHHLGNFAVSLFLLKQMIAANTAITG